MCEGNPAGGSFFQECQPGTCTPELLKGAITGLTDGEATMWINGYVLRSSPMQYYGKFYVPTILRISMIWNKNIRFVFVMSALLHNPLKLLAVYCFVHVALYIHVYCLYFHNNLQI